MIYIYIYKYIFTQLEYTCMLFLYIYVYLYICTYAPELIRRSQDIPRKSAIHSSILAADIISSAAVSEALSHIPLLPGAKRASGRVIFKWRKRATECREAQLVSRPS